MIYKIKFYVNKIEYSKEFECSYKDYVIKMKKLFNELIDKNIFIDNDEIFVSVDNQQFKIKLKKRFRWIFK